MLASQSDIAKHSCLYSQEAVALQMPGVFFLTHPVRATRAYWVVNKTVSVKRLFFPGYQSTEISENNRWGKEGNPLDKTF